MNGYERIKSALAGVKPDTTPIMLHNFMMAAREAGYTMEQYRNNPRIIAECFIRAVEKYQYDGVLVDVDTVTLAGACGVKVDFPVDEPARSHDGILHALSDVKNLPVADVSSYRYANIWCESVRLLKEHFGHEVYVRGNCDQAPFSLATMLRGVENLMIDLCMESEDVIFSLLDYCCDVTCQFIQMMKEAGAEALKIEGGVEIAEDIKKIIDAGIPVMGHLGLMPQSINKYGTYTVRAKEDAESEKLLSDAKLLEELGCFAVVLEKIPAQLAKQVTESLKIPTIGIGAGQHTDGQVLVMQDMLGISQGFSPRFLRRYADLNSIINMAVQQYISDVKSCDFPNENEQY